MYQICRMNKCNQKFYSSIASSICTHMYLQREMRKLIFKSVIRRMEKNIFRSEYLPIYCMQNVDILYSDAKRSKMNTKIKTIIKKSYLCLSQKLRSTIVAKCCILRLRMNDVFLFFLLCLQCHIVWVDISIRSVRHSVQGTYSHGQSYYDPL